jgi:hypothetical protein
MLSSLALSLAALVLQVPAPGAADELQGSEAIAGSVSRVVRELDRAFLASGDPLAGELGEGWVDGDARAVIGPPAGDPSSWVAAISPRPVAVQRAGEVPMVLDPSTGREDAIEDLRSSFRALFGSLGGAPTRAAEINVKGVQPTGDGAWDVRLRVRHLREVAGEEARSAKSIWTLRVSEAADGTLALLGWAGSVVEEVALQGSPGFEDVTATALGGAPATEWLADSIMGLRDRLDVDVGVGLLGHHGVAVADVNGDGLEDLYLCQPGGVPNQLWLRLPGGQFMEAARGGGLDLVDATTSALFVDLDGDADLDVVLGLASGVVVLARTEQGYVEAERFERSGITSLTAADINMDGRLDVYACAYANPYDGSTFPLPYHDAENGQANLLIANVTEEPDKLILGDATEETGLDRAGSRFSFAATFEDVDDDGDPDLYVANDFGRNALYINNGTGYFRNLAAELGVEDVAAGMGAAFADMDRDGQVDLYVSNMESSAGRRITSQRAFQGEADEATLSLFRRHAKGNSLFLRAPDGGFVESGLATAGHWAWGGIPVDLDGNGWLDLFVPNGFVSAERPGAPDL